MKRATRPQRLSPRNGKAQRRPARPSWRPLRPVGGSWLAILPKAASKGIAELHALLDMGVLEAWMDDLGNIELVPNVLTVESALDLLDSSLPPVAGPLHPSSSQGRQ